VYIKTQVEFKHKKISFFKVSTFDDIRVLTKFRFLSKFQFLTTFRFLTNVLICEKIDFFTKF